MKAVLDSLPNTVTIGSNACGVYLWWTMKGKGSGEVFLRIIQPNRIELLTSGKGKDFVRRLFNRIVDDSKLVS